MEFQIIAGELCLDFINTLDNRPSPERHTELLSTYGNLADWAFQAGAIGPAQKGALLAAAARRPHAAVAALRKAIELRECLYRIISHGLRNQRPDPSDVKVFNGFLGEALGRLQLQLRRGGYRLQFPGVSGPRLDSLLWPIAKSASNLLTSGDLSYVHECDSPSCRWMFVDRSKNHSRRWCDMKVCGNRLKARRFYHRQHTS
ncbi:MAG TPA: ABATE domain-containing protein [Terriglobales bacterium]|nr:ABATE domain-containing protein [Terriglobales bacterium]